MARRSYMRAVFKWSENVSVHCTDTSLPRVYGIDKLHWTRVQGVTLPLVHCAKEEVAVLPLMSQRKVFGPRRWRNRADRANSWDMIRYHDCYLSVPKKEVEWQGSAFPGEELKARHFEERLGYRAELGERVYELAMGKKLRRLVEKLKNRQEQG